MHKQIKWQRFQFADKIVLQIKILFPPLKISLFRLKIIHYVSMLVPSKVEGERIIK
jgi:hypothetical protein